MSERLTVGVAAQRITGRSGFCSHLTVWAVEYVLLQGSLMEDL